MSQRILDEREHRRGLVLGLTLAEILILLLFLMLLALGVRLNKLEQEKKGVEKEREEIRVVLDAIRPHLPKGEDRLDERSAKELASKLRFAIQLAQAFPALSERLDVVRELVGAGVRIDPDDPPAALEVARDLLKKLGPGSSSTQIAALEKKVAELEAKLADKSAKGSPGKPLPLAGRTMAVLEAMGRLAEEGGAHHWPPIITLSEARGYSFATGSADVTPDFRVKLSTEVVEHLEQIVKRYHVDVIEVIGHTDERPFNVSQPKPEATPDSADSTPRLRPVRRPSNLDTALIPFLSGKGDSERLLPSDNVGLGLARAASVVRILAKESRLANVRILPLSGGQLIQVGDILSAGSPGDAKERRRIEIRARRSDKSAKPWEGRVSQDTPLVPGK